MTLEVSQTYNVGATSDVEGEHISGVTFTYETHNPEIATVDDSGIVTAVSPGSTVIIVTGSKEGYESGNSMVEITVEVEPVITTNHNAIDASNPVFATSGGYFLSMGFEVSRDLDLTHENVQFISYYEYSTDGGDTINTVKNQNEDPFKRSKEWGFVRYGEDHVNPNPQPNVLEAGTEYYFAATGNTIDRLNSLYTLTEETNYQVRVVYEITDESRHTETSYSPWVNFIR